jgi:DNA-binding NarL/FixJ family response regulator
MEAFSSNQSSRTRFLSRHELEVAELVTLGPSNPTIARRLWVSPRTVVTHVTHILIKLGLLISNRDCGLGRGATSPRPRSS